MAKRLMAIPMALAVILGTSTASFAQSQDAQQPQVRADLIRMNTDQQIADLPGGHWATHATQVAVANNILPVEGTQFMGDRPLTADELRHAMEALANTAENIAGKGALTELRTEIGMLPDNGNITRLQLSQALARFLDSANQNELIATAAPLNEASRLKDLGASVPPAVRSVVDKYKVMTGFKDGTFRPTDTVTRYQMAAIALHILDDMRQAPIAQLPVQPTQPAPATVVMVPPAEPEVQPIETPVLPTSRLNFRQNAPIHLSWQALNQENLSGASGQPFQIIPVSGMITGYQGPVMLQGVANFRYNMFQDNLLDTEFRIGYSDLKWGMVQLIPYVGANVGLGASIPTGATQYDTYVGATYGGILSVMPMDNLEIFGSLGQAALLGAGRWNQNFQPVNQVGALGTFLSNYGVGADFYVSPNIALTLGLNAFQQPADLRTATDYNAGVINTLGGNVGVGFSF